MEQELWQNGYDQRQGLSACFIYDGNIDIRVFPRRYFRRNNWKTLIVKNMRGATSVLGQKCECEAENDKHKNEKIFPPYPYLVTYN